MNSTPPQIIENGFKCTMATFCMVLLPPSSIYEIAVPVGKEEECLDLFIF